MEINKFKRVGLGLAISAALIGLYGFTSPAAQPSVAPANQKASSVQPSEAPPMRRQDYRLDVLPSRLSEKIYSTTIHQRGASRLELHFDRASLPAGGYVEISNGVSAAVTTYRDKDLLDHPIPMLGDTAVIRVVLPQLNSTGALHLSHVNYQLLSDSQALIGEDDRRPLVCYTGKPFYEQGLASVNVRHGRTGSGALVGNGHYLLTNAHVTDGQPGDDVRQGSIWLNWFNQQCDRNSPANEPLDIRLDRIQVLGEPGSFTDYSLVSLNTFDVQHARVPDLFGSLAIRPQAPNRIGEEIYIPQYGNGGLIPEVIGDRWENENATIIGIDSSLLYNADTQPGSSGSPVLSRATHELIGVHWGSSGANRAVPLSVLQSKVLPLIKTGNQHLRGAGLVQAKAFLLPPFATLIKPIAIPPAAIVDPFLEIKMTHHGDHSEVVLDSQDELTYEIKPARFSVALQNTAGAHDLSTPAANDEKLVISYLPESAKDSVSTIRRAWLPLKIKTASGALLQNLVVRLQTAIYDPFVPPFDLNAPDVIKLNFNIADAKKAHTLEQKITGAQYGYIAFYDGEGPMNITLRPDGVYSEVQLPLKNQAGKLITLRLRGYRQIASWKSPMNASAVGDPSEVFSRLILEYVPADNPNLPAGSYDGILPLQAQSVYSHVARKNILVELHVDTEQSGAQPHAVITGPATVKGGSKVKLYGAASTGKALKYAWTGPAGIPISQEGATATFTAPKASQEQHYTFKLVVTDVLERQDEATHHLTVRATGGEEIPAWDPAKTYDVPCTKVRHAGKVWMNGWYLKGVEPGTEDKDGGWRAVGSNNMHPNCE